MADEIQGPNGDGLPPHSGRPLDVVVVGLGKMGLLHGALLTRSGRARVVGIADRSRYARIMVRGLGLRIPTYTDLDRAVRAHPDAAAYYVCTPPHAHEPVATTALEAGAHVFVEKPLTVSAEGSARLASAASRRGLRGYVGYYKRHNPVFRRLRDEIGAAGGAAEIEVTMRSAQFVGAADASTAARGGIEWDLLPHCVDTALWAAGARPDGVPVIDGVTRRGHEAVTVLGRMGKTRFSLTADWAAPQARKVQLHARAALQDGTVLEADDAALLRSAGPKERVQLYHRRLAPPPWYEIADAEYSDQTLDALTHFATGAPIAGAGLGDGARVDAFVARVAATEAEK